MAGFNLTSHENPLGISSAGFVISPDTKREAWAISIEQCLTVDAVQVLAHGLYSRMEMLRGREAPQEIEREAIALCAARVTQLTAKSVKALPDAFGHRL